MKVLTRTEKVICKRPQKTDIEESCFEMGFRYSRTVFLGWEGKLIVF